MVGELLITDSIRQESKRLAKATKQKEMFYLLVT